MDSVVCSKRCRLHLTILQLFIKVYVFSLAGTRPRLLQTKALQINIKPNYKENEKATKAFPKNGTGCMYTCKVFAFLKFLEKFCNSFAVRHAWMHVARVQTWKLWKISIVIQMTLPTWNIHIFHLCVTTFYVNDNVICVYIYILCIYLNIYIFMGSKVNRKTEANPCLVHIGRYRVETVHGFDLLNWICFSIPWNRKTRCFRKHHCKMHAELQPFRKRFLWTFS